MWLLILKVALLVIIAGGVVAIVATYVRRSRAVRFRQEPDPTLGPLGQMGVVAPTPLPEWAHWTDTDEQSKPPGDAKPPAR